MEVRGGGRGAEGEGRVYEAYEVEKKRERVTLSITSPEKEKKIIFMM